jgi:hypothetical protein
MFIPAAATGDMRFYPECVPGASEFQQAPRVPRSVAAEEIV